MQAAHEMPVPTAAEAVLPQMRAVVYRRYGEPEVLACEEVARPTPGDDEVLVRVHAAAVSIGDHHIVTGKPYLVRLSPFGGVPGPRHPVPGAALAGRVEAVGAKITTLRPGDAVFGQAPHGAFAEYVVVPAAHVAPKPANLSFEEAAAVPWAATALIALRGVVAGQRVLVNGASGGVGTWAVQIAKALGAEVTAVCSARNVDMVRGLGADTVIDYGREDFAVGGERFHVMLDLVGNRPLSDCFSVLVPGGIYVPCSGGGGDWFGPVFRMVAVLLRSLFSSKKVRTFVMAPDPADLLFLKDLVESGKAKPVIERRYPLTEVADALRHVGEGHARGQSVIQVA
jgi:NADPH:quinone reductase-like Zn-dependent oxidoreductase